MANDRQTILNALVAHLQTVHAASGKRPDSQPIDVDADLYESGYLDSLSVSQFLLLAEKQFGVTLPDWLIGQDTNSLAGLAGYIETQLHGARK